MKAWLIAWAPLILLVAGVWRVRRYYVLDSRNVPEWRNNGLFWGWVMMLVASILFTFQMKNFFSLDPSQDTWIVIGLFGWVVLPLAIAIKCAHEYRKMFEKPSK